ncbi:DUF4350 domain-containing protein [Mucilaginibacter sp. BT774]|uniref:DUF4350 domain-containing protein n=1 Tax=Mucilaginibacter sp. BT774 TaxID=3062276 RepID=UPI002674B20C|nr:DUF4350 domain-containing protein [Mucilaginibacter sp. BT774]MDO3626856.1 DUF4350 domain-containing protein [Mucilaginibacter sp. BT774]
MRDFKIYISIASILLVIYLVAQYNKPSPINWQPTLYYQDKIPYGTYILHNELQHFFPGATVTNTNQNLYDLFHNSNDTNGNYLIVSKSVNISKYDYKELVAFIEKGNSVLISALGWGGKFADTLDISTGVELKKKQEGLNFTNEKLKEQKSYQYDKDITSEYFVSFDTAHAVVLGKNENGHATLLRFKHGSGTLYLCANPLIFSNYALLSNRGDDYATKVLSYLPKSKAIYWDEYQNGDIPEDTSPMRVFFNNPALSWAYYLSLFGIVIFVLYEMKRRQRIIPIIEPLKNSTVEFANVVGQVYYEQRNNMNIAQKMIVFFYEHLRTKYYLKTNPLDAEFVERLSQKTGIEFSFAQELIGHIKYVLVQHQVSDHELIRLNQLIEQFYKKTR